MKTVGEHYSAATDRFACFSKYNGIRFRRGKYRTDYFQTILY